MDIIINNCSSAGASFSDGINNTFVQLYNFVCEEPNKCENIKDLRKSYYEKFNLSSYARNMFTLVRECGFIRYENGQTLKRSDLFTDLGKSYVLTYIQLLSLADKDEAVKNEIEKVQRNILFLGVRNITKSDSYGDVYKEVLKYTYENEYIDVIEFAYMLYTMQNDVDEEEVKNNIKLYRSGDIDINVKVRVRDDTNNSNGSDRIGDLKDSSAFTYIVGLYMQAGILYSEQIGQKKKYYFNKSMSEKVRMVLEGE